ncbi:hypothetical protein OF83DRAFT_1103745 [Amylostereum chailletii]|nr:hypothetical protein OF83DRAFT_1103745 [Amylostereum chailletii]
MATSELLDALNPHVIRQPRSVYPCPELSQSPPQPAFAQPLTPHLTPHAPHRSELEFAITEPPPPAPVATPQKLDPTQIIQELVRALSAAKSVQEGERRRQAARENELDAKHRRREAELETEIAELKQEVAYLKAYIAASRSQFPVRPQQHSPLLLDRPSTSSVVTLPDTPVPSHAAPTPHYISTPDRVSVSEDPAIPVLDGRSTVTFTPEPSQPPSSCADSPVASSSNPAAKASSPRKRPAPTSIDGDDSTSSEASRSSAGKRPLKRVNRHDKRCYTIQNAMRKQLYRSMNIEPDEDLPRYTEGLPLESNEPVRFVWEKTTKQSEHNAKMKVRILAELKANRRLYKHVPDADFQKAVLEPTFEQAYLTLRQKFKTQTDANVANVVKMREKNKAMKSRRNSRKKLKLANRLESRKKAEVFSHATFDGAMQMECMSSEESEGEAENPKDKVFVVRGMPWRSTRLLKFYGILDEEQRLDMSSKPKRGSGRQNRNEGTPKDGFSMPPRGVGSWMISRRWLRDIQLAHSEVLGTLQGLIDDKPGFDWIHCDVLGYESDDESNDMTRGVLRNHGSSMLSNTNNVGYSSLLDALQPVPYKIS